LSSKYSILGNIITKVEGNLRKLTNVEIKGIISLIIKIDIK